MPFSSLFIKVEHQPEQQLLIVEWPDVSEDTIPKFWFALESLILLAKEHQIKKLLIDTRSALLAIDDEVYEELSIKFGQGLRTVGLEKVARTSTEDSRREALALATVQKAGIFTDYQIFDVYEDALAWLVQEEKGFIENIPTC